MRLSSLIAGGLLVLSLAAGCSSGEEKKKGETAPPEPVKGAVREVVKAALIPESITASGTVRAGTSALVAARIPGTVDSLSAREGDRVKKGAILLTLSAQESVAGSRVASAAVEEAKRGVDDASARLKLAESTLRRFQSLYREQAVTKQELEVKEMEAEVAKQNLARAQSRLSQSSEGEKGASAIAAHTKVSAPLSGVIVQKHVELGSTVFPGSPLFTVEAEGSYRLELSVPENLMGKVKVGTPIDIAIDGIQQKQRARVLEVVPLVDPATRTFIVKTAVSGAGLRSGLYGKGTLATGSAEGILLPKNAVRTRGALTSVWVVDNGIARLRIVRTGRETGDRVEIISGITAGESVIVGGTFPTVEGAKVE